MAQRVTAGSGEVKTGSGERLGRAPARAFAALVGTAYTGGVSYLLVGGILVVVALFALAAAVVVFVVRVERRHDEAERARKRLGAGPAPSGTRTGDISLFLRFEDHGADAMKALVERFGPHGVLPQEAVGEVAGAILAALDEATHGEVVVAAYRVVAVRSPVDGGLFLCFRTQSRTPLLVIEDEARPSVHRKHLRDLLRAIAALDASQVVSGDLLTASITHDRAAPELRTLLGPHGTPSALP
jgi:hypothetical protein